MKVELTQDLDLVPAQVATLDLHSFLNVINVLAADLLFLQDWLGEALEPALEGSYQLAEGLRDGTDLGTALKILVDYRELFFSTLESALSQSPAAQSPDVIAQVDNLRSIWRVIDLRYSEMKSRLEKPEEWSLFSADKLTEEFEKFLGAVEKNSQGRYHIVTNIARKEPADYVVHLHFSGPSGDEIRMPPVLKDVFRDILANARKYTEPGGTIQAGLAQDSKQLKLVIRDSGRGIPQDQLAQVVEFGFRARNVEDTETKGGGFGLTKAYWTARRFGGRMWIESELNQGTTVTIEVPNPRLDA